MQRFVIVMVLIFSGCANELIYRTDFEKKESDYYQATIEYEKNLQTVNIQGIEKKYANAQELCHILDNRLVGIRDQHEILGVALKLYRLSKTLEIFEQMRQSSYDIVRLTFSREDLVTKPLQIEFDLEMQDMQEFLLHLMEARVRLIHLDIFRKKSLLLGDRPEEKLQNFDIVSRNIHNSFKDMMYKDLTAHFINLGIAITRDSKFEFSVANPKYADINLDDKNVLLPQKQVDIAKYEYYFDEEKEEFTLYVSNLKLSLARFKKAIEMFKQHRAQGGSGESTTIALKLMQMTEIMEQTLGKIEKLFEEASSDLQTIIGTKIVNSAVLAQGKPSETEEMAKTNNAQYYLQHIQGLGDYLGKTLYTNNPDSESSIFLKKFSQLEKDFNQNQGSWTTGYVFLNQEWKDKVSFQTVSGNFEKLLKQLEDMTKDSLNPLYKTYIFYFNNQPDNQNKKPPFILDNGYLKENKN